MPTAYIGTSGFSYQHWRGVFYPQGLSTRRWLEFYLTQFNTVELNVTFYRMPTESMVRGWHAQAEKRPDFRFAVKLSQFITHRKRLIDADDSLALFESRVRTLGPYCGPILAQLPPHWHADLARLDDFLAHCDPGFRWAVEFRDASWLSDAVFAVLARHQAALCIHDLLPDHPRAVTAPFTYVRFHGYDTLYSGDYPDSVLKEWAKQLRAWQDRGLDVYAYFNNDAGGFAPKNARTLRAFGEDGGLSRSD